MVNGTQITLAYHVDNIKISHVDPEEVKRCINWFKSIYGTNVASEMIGDHFTKLLQGALFCKFCSVIMNIDEEVQGC